MHKNKGQKFIYRIILTSHNKQIKELYKSKKEDSIYSKFNKIIEENSKNIIFPVRYINNGGLKDANYEIMIIKEKQKNESKETKLRDEYGRYISYVTTSDKWIIINRADYYREESFWVYGFHPQLDRKDFNWIFKNYIKKNCNKYSFKNILVFKNKLIIDINGELNIIFCKNKSDSIRLYNQLEVYAKKNKLKYIIWSGDISYSQFKKDLIDRLLKFTGWSFRKLNRSSLRP